MAEIAEITLQKLPKGFRLDAEYYRPGFLANEDIVKSLDHWQLKDLASELRSFGAYDLTNQFSYVKEGVPYIRCTNLKEGYVDFSDVYYIDEDAHKLLSKSCVNPGTVLLAMSGSVGNAAIADESWRYPANSNQDVAKIVCRDICDPYYLTVFLNSRFGRSQVLRLPVGSVQQHIFLWQIETLKIPKLTDSYRSEVAEIYKNALGHQEEAKKLYRSAERILANELMSDNGQGNHSSSYSEVRFSDLKNTARIDAEYFQPRYERARQKIYDYKGGWSPLTEAIRTSSETWRINPESEYRYVELADIDSSLGVISGGSVLAGAELPSRARMKLRKGDVLVPSVEGSLDKVALVNEQQDNLVGSTGFFVFRKEGLLPEVSLVLCKSPIIQLLLKREAQGTILTAIPTRSLKRVPVPVLGDAIQKEIADLVRGSHKSLQLFQELLADAKRRLEAMIEEASS